MTGFIGKVWHWCFPEELPAQIVLNQDKDDGYRVLFFSAALSVSAVSTMLVFRGWKGYWKERLMCEASFGIGRTKIGNFSGVLAVCAVPVSVGSSVFVLGYGLELLGVSVRRAFKATFSNKPTKIAKLNTLATKIDAVIQGLGLVEGRIGLIEGRMAAIEGRMAAIEAKVDSINQSNVERDAKITLAEQNIIVMKIIGFKECCFIDKRIYD
uniref:Uncharacterized protein n=1 Tax=Ditylenchus dipsaci TaxID=166011 RepID=A0A915DD33_9BILA